MDYWLEDTDLHGRIIHTSMYYRRYSRSPMQSPRRWPRRRSIGSVHPTLCYNRVGDLGKYIRSTAAMEFEHLLRAVSVAYASRHAVEAVYNRSALHHAIEFAIFIQCLRYLECNASGPNHGHSMVDSHRYEFPSSSLTVVSSTREDTLVDAVVPTFNATDAGNKSYAYINSHSFSTFSFQTDPHDNILNIWSGADLGSTPYTPFSIRYLANVVLTSGTVLNTPSPCGANCSYTLQFTGPYMQCTSTDIPRRIEKNITELARQYPAIRFTAYNSTLVPQRADADSQTQPHLHFVTARATNEFAVQVARTYMNGSEEVSDRRYRADMVESHLDCVPSKAEYTVQMAYQENIQHVTVSTDESSIRPLSSLVNQHIVVPLASYQTPGMLNSTAIAFFEDANLATLIYAMAQKLTGTFNASLAAISSTETDNSRHDYQQVEATVSPTLSLPNETARETLMTLSRYFSPVHLSTADRVNILYPQTSSIFTVNATTLNTILANITLSTIPFTNYWSTHATQTRIVPVNVFAFSQPLNLILPYAVLLGGGLCALVLGGWALRTNGVAATDGGFLQILTTTRGSAEVDRVARGCCLGSEEIGVDEFES
ncbi:hypothetical protein BJX96DRAFT_155612 [Aspergillus floccosus]